ncbi:MAG TPA: DedA family protein, partial [Bryobacteraceae bacterium]|nr:DedA family protein [Bryobacteraceae bacterium]
NGYPAIFSLLVLGIVGLPVPDETLLTFTGYLIYKNHLHPVWAFLAALGGSLCGITISYTLGRTFGLALIHRYGRYLHLDEVRIEKAHDWFARIGRWALTFGYFIPGVRHFTAYAAGMSDLEPHWFAVFAYSGGLLWTTTFLSLGYFLGDHWERVVRQLHEHVLKATVAAAVLMLAYWIWRRWKARRS